MLKSRAGEQIRLIEAALALLFGKKWDRDNKDPRRHLCFASHYPLGQQPAQGIRRWFDLLIFEKVNQPPQDTVIATIRICT